MKNQFYRIKNFIFKLSKEARKIKRPSYEELIRFNEFKKTNNNKLALSFGAGRSGQNWFSKIFNSHPNWIGTAERFRDYESFYRYISYYNLLIDREGVFKLFELASKRDMAMYQNSFIASVYLSFGIKELNLRLKPDYLFYHLRDPIKCIESLHAKKWYDTNYLFKENTPLIDISTGLQKSFSRIIPQGNYLYEWLKLTRIGKIAWFWATINKTIFNDFNELTNNNKFFIKLEDVNQNYEFYEKLAYKFNFEKIMNKKKFYDVINKSPNKGLRKKHFYKNWSSLEKKEFDEIVNKLFPHYRIIKTNI